MTPAEEFLRVAAEYRLGTLETEAQHPLTMSLDRLAATDVNEAIATLRQVDIEAIERLRATSARLADLARAIAETFDAGRRVFLCGCGATGRLSLSLEVLCRMGVLPTPNPERVVAFMAGGDLALIKAIEHFEDRPDYGARQLDELGFAPGDLLIASTEGGETPFVIGATERAADRSSNAPWFLYCNPDAQLQAVAERSRRVLADPRIRKLNLTVGPMALAGSTRMQASTVLMAAIGFALMHHERPDRAATEVAPLLDATRRDDAQWLAPFVIHEAAAYARHDFVLYESARFGITVVTDTTERAPTFSLAPFERQDDPSAPASWCHFLLPAQPDAQAAWAALLRRRPRTLDWPEVARVAGADVLACYDMSAQLLARRQMRTNHAVHVPFRIDGQGAQLVWDFDGCRARVDLTGMHEFHAHLRVKMLLNTHSTLVMGRLGRYVDNLMTYVRPSNHKLIDRAVRYVQLLAARRTGQRPAYDDVTRVLFDERERLTADEPIVLRTLAALGIRA